MRHGSKREVLCSSPLVYLNVRMYYTEQINVCYTLDLLIFQQKNAKQIQKKERCLRNYLSLHWHVWSSNNIKFQLSDMWKMIRALSLSLFLSLSLPLSLFLPLDLFRILFYKIDRSDLIRKLFRFYSDSESNLNDLFRINSIRKN